MDVPDDLNISNALFLPIFTAIARRIRLVETIDFLVRSEMAVGPGRLVLAMVLDVLSGRHPLYRIREFFETKDLELLLGEDIDPSYLSDDTFGRLLDHLYEANTSLVFSQLAMNALKAFDLPTNHVHFDTTSQSVYGAYDPPAEDDTEDDAPAPFQITHGFSKDHRPDLKQFLFAMLCVGGNVPIFGKIEDGNASDKTINNAILSSISEKLAAVGLSSDASIYIADSAMVTEANLNALRDKIHFITRLPATYTEHDRVVREAVAAGQWVDYGTLAQTPSTPKRPAARYRGYETSVCLYGTRYRAIVVHSSAHDRRRLKRLSRQIQDERKACTLNLRNLAKTFFFCREDAQGAAHQLASQPLRYHAYELQVVERPRYARGRPRADGTRVIAQMRYAVTGCVREQTDAIARAREEAGCFVILTNVPPEGPPWADTPYDGRTVLVAYKDQGGIERNFGFTKDPVIVNALFLKSPKRIEALGLVLLIALLLWRLVESSLRRHVQKTGRKIPGWDNKPTDRPTTFMMTTKFSEVLVMCAAGKRALARPLNAVQRAYLHALGLSDDIFIRAPPAGELQ